MLNGILWVFCSGAPWRDVLDGLGPWSSVYQRFHDWRNQRVFDQMLKRLQLKLNENRQIDLKTWMIDSTAVRASRSSARSVVLDEIVMCAPQVIGEKMLAQQMAQANKELKAGIEVRMLAHPTDASRGLG
ncbi:ISPs1 [Pseudomonas syringae pv. syringae]|nr:ISPs1 [Pseudomonas syringae pv. syringae]